MLIPTEAQSVAMSIHQGMYRFPSVPLAESALQAVFNWSSSLKYMMFLSSPNPNPSIPRDHNQVTNSKCLIVK